MNLYNIVFLNFYKFRKLIREDGNDRWSCTFVSVIQELQIFGLLFSMSYLGVSFEFFKSKPLMILLLLPLYFANQLYFFTPQKLAFLIEEDSRKSEREKKLNMIYALIIIFSSIAFFFIMMNLAIQKK